MKNDDFSHKVVGMIRESYLQCKDVIFIKKVHKLSENDKFYIF